MTELRDGNGLATAEKPPYPGGSRARELKASGKKVIGYLSALGPVEIMTAAGVVPIRLKGNVSAISKGDAYMESNSPFVRNVFDAAVKGKYDFLDGMVLLTSAIRSTAPTRPELHPEAPLLVFFNVPHVTDDPSITFAKEILRIFIGNSGEIHGNEDH